MTTLPPPVPPDRQHERLRAQSVERRPVWSNPAKSQFPEPRRGPAWDHRFTHRSVPIILPQYLQDSIKDLASTLNGGNVLPRWAPLQRPAPEPLDIDVPTHEITASAPAWHAYNALLMKQGVGPV